MTRISRVNLLRSPLALAVGATVLVAGGAGVAVGASSAHPKAVKVCVTKKGVVRAASAKGKCPRSTHKLTIGVRGLAGPRGRTGAPGPTGEPGPAIQNVHRVIPEDGVAHQVPDVPFSAYCFNTQDVGITFDSTSNEAQRVYGTFEETTGNPQTWNWTGHSGNDEIISANAAHVELLYSDSDTGRNARVDLTIRSLGDSCDLSGQVFTSS